MTSKFSSEPSAFDPVLTLDMIFENSPAYLTFLRGPHFIIDRINVKARELLQLTDIVGKTVLEILPEIEAQGYIEILTKVYETKEPFFGSEIPLHLINAGGGEKQLFIDFVYQPLFDRQGNVLGVISQGYDVTEKVRIKQTLLEYNQNLEKMVEERTRSLKSLNEELESFSYSVSHDLRTPLRSIEGFSQAVLEDDGPQLSERGMKDLKRVIDASQAMGKLIDDLLTLSRLGRREMVSKPISMDELAAQIFKRLKEDEPTRDVTFDLGKLPEVVGDPGLIHVALENLISNAWKFTAGKAQARISLHYEKVGDRLAFVLRDNGAGFNMAFYDKLFGAFQRLHTTSEFKGTGVGLALVRRIISRHKGEIWAEAQVGEGAVFYLQLPLANLVK